jgi:hypothetical protein
VTVAGCLLAGSAEAVLAGHFYNWRHDHSSSAIPRRPKGLQQLRNRFGNACNDRADNARTWFPSARARNRGGYVKYHARLARNVGHNIRGHIARVHREGAVDYGVYGYLCRLKRGGTSYSTHAWGVAIDTNTKRNPQGQARWNGRGADGRDYGTYLPKLWKGPDPGHRFRWGRNFSTPDPHHFQYVTGY